MKKNNSLLSIIIVLVLMMPRMIFSQSSDNSEKWIKSAFEPKVFIENIGQVSTSPEITNNVLYYADEENVEILFDAKGITWKIKQIRNNKEQYEKWILKEMNEMNGGDEKEKTEKTEQKGGKRLRETIYDIDYLYIRMDWAGANENLNIICSEQGTEVFNFYNPHGNNEEIYGAKGFKKLIIQNLYDGINAEYSFHPEEGLKYQFVVQPGADISQIKMKYTGFEKMECDENGNLILSIKSARIIDHAPLSYQNSAKNPIASAFIVKDNTVSFSVDRWNQSELLVIDPWVQTFTGGSINNGLQVEIDGSGNAYVFGNVTNLRLRKFSPTGTPLWTYNSGYGDTQWPGNLAVEFGGNAYISNGNATANIDKVSSAGTNIFDQNSGGDNFEVFLMTFNNDQSILASCNKTADFGIANVNTSTGMTSGLFTSAAMNEVRGLASSPNGRWYCLTEGTNTAAGSQVISLNNAFSTFFVLSSGYTGQEMPYTGPSYAAIEGFSDMQVVPGPQNCVDASWCWFYTYSGKKLMKRDAYTGALINTINVANGSQYYDPTGGPFGWGLTITENSGIIIDSCDNIYVGTTTGISKYDRNLNFITSVNTPAEVYDITFGKNDEIIAAGNGFAGGFSGLDPMLDDPIILDAVSNECETATADVINNCNFPINYLWSNGETTQTITGVDAGLYTVTVSFECRQWVDFVEVEPCGVNINLEANPDTICVGENTELSVTYGDGQPPYTITWNNGLPQGEGPHTVSPTTTTTYIVTLTDALGVTDSDTLTVYVGSIPVIDLSSTGTSCFNICDGTASANVAMGTPGYEYLWSDSQTTQTVVGLCAGSYTLTVTDSFGCTDSESVIIEQPDEIVIALGSQNANCNHADGTLNVLNISGGTVSADYQFHWENSSGTTVGNTASVNNQYPGIYYLTVTDDNGCTAEGSIEIINSPGGTINPATIVHVSCYGDSDGTISVSITGGAPPFDYVWSGPSGYISMDQNITGLYAGDYSVTVTDNYGCTTTGDYSVNQPNPLIITLSSGTNYNGQDISCFGASDGSIDLVLNGGTAPYTYIWTGPGSFYSNDEDPHFLSVGTYTVSVVDDNDCKIIETITLTEPYPLSTNIEATPILCFGDTDGELDLTVTGGVSPYQYLWNNYNTNQDLTGLSAGLYIVTIVDDNNCVIIDSAVIATIDEPLSIVFSTVNLMCYGNQNGSIDATITGGTPGYLFQWNNGFSTEDIQNLTAGIYSLTVSDNNGCTLSASAEITQPEQLLLGITNDQSICIDDVAVLSASTTGGVPPYLYTWSSGPVTSSIIVSPPTQTTYYVTVTDQNGCQKSDNVTVFVYDSLFINSVLSDYVICIGEETTVFSLFGGGNGGPYIITLNNEIISTPYTFSPTESGSITVCIKDMCTTPAVCQNIYIDVVPLPEISYTADIYNGCEPLMVHFTSMENNGVVEYNWNFGDPESYNTSAIATPEHFFENEGIYDVSLSVVDTNGCIGHFSWENMIEVYPLPLASFYPEPMVASIFNPIIYFNNTSDLAHECVWDFGDGSSSTGYDISHTFPEVGPYDVQLIVSTIHNCLDTASCTVSIKDEFTFYAPTAFTPGYDGNNDVFFVTGTGIKSDHFKMYIYDRWGEIIYETDHFNPENPSEGGWDGRVKDNHLAISGSYTWLVIFRDVFDNEHEYAGVVNVIR